MMKCLCCGKELLNEKDKNSGWHVKCIKSFFGTSDIPEISLAQNEIEKLANQSVNKGLTVPGVQKKLSLHLDQSDCGARFTLVDYPTGYILKPKSPDYDQLPEMEHLAMTMARATGIKVVPFGLVKMDGEYAYITKRVDRMDEKKLAMEDFCQLSGRSTDDKYKGSYEECGRFVKLFSSRKGFDLTELFLRLVFCGVIGNSDMHLKNFSMKEMSWRSREYVLSEAYDILPVNIVIPADKDYMALTLNGKKRNIRRKDYIALAMNMEISSKAAEAIIDKVIGKASDYQNMIQESIISAEYKERFLELMGVRIGLLEK